MSRPSDFLLALDAIGTRRIVRGDGAMRVNVFHEDTETLLHGNVALSDVMGDDICECARAASELKRSGRYWTGGGAQPLFYLKPVRDQ